MDLYCNMDSCEYYEEGRCNAECVEIAEALTAGGFLPLCDTYREKEYPTI